MNYNCWALQYYLFQKKKRKKVELIELSSKISFIF